MADATLERPRRGERRRGTVPVPGYALDPENDTNAAFERRSSAVWRAVAGLVQALLVVFVVLAALSTVVRP